MFIGSWVSGRGRRCLRRVGVAATTGTASGSCPAAGARVVLVLFALFFSTRDETEHGGAAARVA